MPDLRVMYASATSSGSFADLTDWIVEFLRTYIHEKNIQIHISMLAEGDDDFLGCSRNTDGSSLSSWLQDSSRKKFLVSEFLAILI